MTGRYDITDVPAFITVHLGGMNDVADNVTVRFPDYIKTVASLSFDPQSPEEALKAGIYAQISKALYRIKTREYKMEGYGFDITTDSETDLPYSYGGAVFENINRITDGIFNEYITRVNDTAPINANICYSDSVCDGLKFAESVEMAENGASYLDILKYYYGDDIRIEKNARVGGLDNLYLIEYPTYPGQSGAAVSGLQISLNKIGANYTSIPFIERINGIYGQETVSAVREFQRIFDLEVTGEVDKSTYYKLLYVLDSIYRLSYYVYLSEQFKGQPTELRSELSYGDVGELVKLLQYYLLVASSFDVRIPPLQIVGVFGENTYQSVIAFQRIFGFDTDGVVKQGEWETLKRTYNRLYSAFPDSAFSERAAPYGGEILLFDSVGAEVRLLQEYLNEVAYNYDNIPEIDINGVFDTQTEEAVKVFQILFGIKPTGVVTSTTWNVLAEVYNAIKAGKK